RGGRRGLLTRGRTMAGRLRIVDHGIFVERIQTVTHGEVRARLRAALNRPLPTAAERLATAEREADDYLSNHPATDPGVQDARDLKHWLTVWRAALAENNVENGTYAAHVAGMLQMKLRVRPHEPRAAVGKVMKQTGRVSGKKSGKARREKRNALEAS